MNHVVIFRCDDWDAAYLNGNLFGQGHSLQPMEWFILGQKVGMNGKVEQIWLDKYQLENDLEDNFPYKLSEIPLNIYQKVQ